MTIVQRGLLLALVLSLSAEAAERPRLGVLVVVDQLSAEAFRSRLPSTSGGFRRLAAEGAPFDAALYQAAPTVTSVGHATLVTGAWAATHGVVGNEWLDGEARTPVASTEDPAYQVLGRAPRDHDGTAPTRLLVPTLADTVRSLSDRARAVSISGKDRSGILMAGRAGLALWFDEDRPTFTTSTYYGEALPAWTRAVNERLGRVMGDGGVPGPESLAERPAAQPLIDTAEVDLALEAVSALGLGQGEAVDLLEVSFSGHDRIGHRFGPDSPEALAEWRHLDRELGRLLEGLDARVGRGRYVLALSADHGVAPRPELMKARGLDAGRVDLPALRARLEAALDEALGPGDWLLPYKTPGFSVRPALKGRVTPAAVERLRAAAARVPGVLDVLWAPDLARGGGGFIEEQYRRGYVPGRTADLLVVFRPYWIAGGGTGTTHSTPYLYDRAVPLVFFGAGVRRGPAPGPAEVVDVAPTLARLLGLPSPAAAQGRVLEQVLAPQSP